jgi:regulator of PEP synthase PpsR (kinase-PPPase family)
MTKKIHVYLVSDSTGETVLSIARAALAHFDAVQIEEHLWSLVRTKGQIDRLAKQMEKDHGIVMFTIIDEEIKAYLNEVCAKLHILAIPVLSGIVNSLANYLEVKISKQPGRQHNLDEEYFKRMNAINYALIHDDGQAYFDLNDADIILVGPSRTSKSPTSIYLAYRGFKTANVPYVLGQKLPDSLKSLKKALIVGLLINPDRLVDIRKNRLVHLNDVNNNTYTDQDLVYEEIAEARKVFKQNNWPIIDVTRKSVEEVAANIISMYNQKS